VQEKAIKLFVVIAVFIILMVGCTNVEIAKKFDGQLTEVTDSLPVAHINVDNYGYYLFNCIPLISGNTKNASTRLFTDTVRVEPVVARLTAEANRLGASKTTNIKTSVEESGIITLWIFWYRGVQASGNAIK
jgi:hypothetical protein